MDRQTEDEQPNRQHDGQKDNMTERQTDLSTDWPTDRQTDKLTLADPIIFGNTYEEHPSGLWPSDEKGVWKVAWEVIKQTTSELKSLSIKAWTVFIIKGGGGVTHFY